MRGWSRLTNRGRIVTLVGVLLSVGGWILHELDLFWLGIFAIGLVLFASLLVWWPLAGLMHVRRIPVTSVPVGTPFPVTLQVSRKRRSGPRLLHFEEVVPPALGTRPRFSVSAPLSELGEEFGYSLTGVQRGRHRIGPLLVRSRDPFGLARNDMAFTTQTEVAVTPRVHELPPLDAGAAGASAEASSSRAGLVGQDDVLVREYRRGDDVRRVHWRSTAKVGSLMVRREEQAWQPTLRLVLDNRRHAHAGKGPTGSFEWAVSAAASIGLSLINHGDTLEVTDVNGPIGGAERDHAVHAQQLLEAFTDIKLSTSDTLPLSGPAGHDRHQGESLLAILGRVDTADLAQLLDAMPGSGNAYAIVLDVDTFAGGAPNSQQAHLTHLLAEHGWSSVLVSRGATVPSAWDLLRQSQQVVA